MINNKKIATAVLATVISCHAAAKDQLLSAREVAQGPIAASEMAIWQGKPLFASQRLGLVIGGETGLNVAVPGQFEYLSVHQDIALTYDTQVDQVQAIRLNSSNMQRLSLLPKRSFQVEWMCLQPRAADNNLYAWIGDDAGQAEQWLLTTDGLWQPQRVRNLSVAMGTIKCAVNNEQLYTIDNNQGLWAYPAAPHTAAESELLLSMPDNELSGLVIDAGRLLMLDEMGRLYDVQGKSLATSFEEQQALESLYVSGQQLWAYSDNSEQFYQAKLTQPVTELAPHNELRQQIIKEIPTAVESAIADRAGDTMDDPAIWVHPTSPQKSRILGTNKRWGLLSFSMQGQQLQAIGAGRLNNVDVRQRVMLGGEYRDIAVASNRDRNSLSIFSLDAEGQLTQLPEQATTLNDIYGLCMYQPSDNELHVFANEKSGLVSQIALKWQDNHLKATEVRQFRVPTQPEGCVADDVKQQLFLGEENVGIWWFDLADTTGEPKGQMIIKAGGPLVADIEGLSLYQASPDEGYLVVSSQGNDSYVLYNSQAPYAYVDRFRIGVNGKRGMDGSAETDGLDVTAQAVGTGKWAQGMMVVQDGRNRMPDQHQNFKWVPWSEISQKLQLAK